MFHSAQFPTYSAKHSVNYFNCLLQIHHVSKNIPPLTCYNLDIHNPMMIIFGRSVTEKVRNQVMLCFPTSPI